MNRITTAVHERHFYNASSRTAAIHERLQGPETELLFMLRLYDSVCLVILHMFISFVFVSAKCLQRDQCHQSSGTAAPLISKGRAELNSKLCFFFFFPKKRTNVQEISYFWASLGEIFQALFTELWCC